MKKKLSFLMGVLLLLTIFVPVQANSVTLTMSAPASIETNQQFSIVVGVSNTTNIAGLTATLNFDSSKLELVSSTGQSGFAATVGTSIVLDTATPVSGSINLVQLTFKATSGFAVGQSTSVSLSNVQAFVNDVEVSGANISRTISISAPKSTNNFLSTLSVNHGILNFDKNKNNYTIIVDNNITNVTINARAEDSKSNVSGTGSKNLQIYNNNFPIRVTAENGSVRTYNVNIVRRDKDGNVGPLSKNNNLASLSIENCDINFNKDVLQYTCEVKNLVDRVAIVASTEDEKATLEVVNVEPLLVGDNKVRIIVTSESEEVKEYVVIVNRSGSAPTVKIEDLKNALKTIASDKIIVEDVGFIDQETLDLINEANKILYVKKTDDNGNIVYQWRFDGNQMEVTQDIKTIIRFDSFANFVIDQITNYTKGFVLTFEKNPTLPSGTNVGVFVGHQYEDGFKLQVYYFDPLYNKLILEQRDLEVVDGFIWLPLTHTSEYFVTPAQLEQQSTTTFDGWMIGTIVLGLILIIVLGFILSKKELVKQLISK